MTYETKVFLFFQFRYFNTEAVGCDMLLSVKKAQTVNFVVQPGQEKLKNKNY